MAESVPPQAIPLPDLSATRRLAGALARLARPGDTIALSGDLGAGKTELARAFIRARLGRADEEVPSPTFTLVQTYGDGEEEIWHADLYRLTRPEEALELGLEDAFGHALVVLEWPDRIARLLPRDRLDLAIGFTGADGGRTATLTPHASWIDRMPGLTQAGSEP
ncbi:tRNA (adenosine(37)-N6)-threonylcarbamoyltransferase complex ATPase subunit type 1 TsaE [Allostella vacuolata]|nr:tRNA (adenosine(37)-N6)-threonylcarbamoyltransferase complex ATPase subunit type 1 TsaE [Stella vacuolata]